MRFTISRTSSRYDAPSPHPSATRNPAIDANDYSDEQWVVDVGNLDDLMALAEDHWIIVQSAETANALPHIEIYNDYRE